MIASTTGCFQDDQRGQIEMGHMRCEKAGLGQRIAAAKRRIEFAGGYI